MNVARSGRRQAEDAGELDSITRNLVEIRVLHYTWGGRTSAAEILGRLHQHGCVTTSPSLARILERMSRKGLIQGTSVRTTEDHRHRDWRLTAKGRSALGMAKEQLRQLTAKWLNNARHKQ